MFHLNRGIRFLNLCAKICKNEIHSRRISTYCVVMWVLFRPGAIINYGFWFRLQVVPYFLPINVFSAGSIRVGESHPQSRAWLFSCIAPFALWTEKTKTALESRYC